MCIFVSVTFMSKRHALIYIGIRFKNESLDSVSVLEEKGALFTSFCAVINALFTNVASI